MYMYMSVCMYIHICMHVCMSFYMNAFLCTIGEKKHFISAEDIYRKTTVGYPRIYLPSVKRIGDPERFEK